MDIRTKSVSPSVRTAVNRQCDLQLSRATKAYFQIAEGEHDPIDDEHDIIDDEHEIIDDEHEHHQIGQHSCSFCEGADKTPSILSDAVVPSDVGYCSTCLTGEESKEK